MEDNGTGNDQGVDTSAQVDTQVDAATTTNQPAQPTVYDLDENALIRIKGQKDPVKFGEYGRSFQSQFTKVSQQRAELERRLRERETRLEQLERERQAAQTQRQSGGQDDIYGQLEQLPYLDGQTAVKVVKSIGQQIQQRDQVLLGALQQMKQMQEIVNRLNSAHTGASFEQKIEKYFQDNSWDPAFKDLAKEVYLAYEGDDLDVEFPRIFGARLEGIEKAFEARRQAAAQKARQNRFVPGKGGNAQPSKPLEIKQDASAKEIADQMWDLFQGSGT